MTMQVVSVPLDMLAPYANNAKLHTEEQISAVAASIREFGFRFPIVAWHDEDGTAEIVAGHARAEAARRVGMREVPVVFADDLTDAQRRALTLVDNSTTMMTGWDEDLLAYELDVLADELDMSELGFSDELPEAPGDEGVGVRMTFTLAPEQRAAIESALAKADTSGTETFGNDSRDGNALYQIVSEWAGGRG